MVSEDTVSKLCSASNSCSVSKLCSASNSCSPTGGGLLQQLPDAVGMLGSVRVLLRYVHAGQPLLGLVVERRTDERDEQRVRPGGPALQLGVGLSADDEG